MKFRGALELEAKPVQYFLPGLDVLEWCERNRTSPFSTPSYKHDQQSQLTRLAELSNSKEVFAKLKSIDWSFTEDDTGYLSHDIHPYPAKFIPQIPRNLIVRLSLPGEMVCDPFGGCGTTALEAILLGRSALSIDINPLARVIGEAKTLTLTKEEDDALCDFTEQLLSLVSEPEMLYREIERRAQDTASFVPQIPSIEEWFHKNAIAELAYLRWRIERLKNSKARTLAKVSFSKSILKASYQDSETRYVRIRREVSEGSVTKLFVSNLSSALKKIRQLGPLLRFREATFKTVDLRMVPMADFHNRTAESLIKNSVDLIVTSPPYPNATDYHLYHRFRLFWLGHDPRDLGKNEIGSHLRHQKEATGFDHYIQEMSLCLDNMFKLLRPGRYAVLVLGDAIFNGRIYDTAHEIAEVSSKAGFQVMGAIERVVHSTKRSFISAARRIRSESILVLRKPSARISLTLTKPPYKLWDYEEQLRKREVEALISHTPKLSLGGELVITTSAMSLDKLRRLTFTHAFSGSEVSLEPTWQAILENGVSAAPRRQKKDPKYVTHGIHAYKGKFYPQLAKSLFNLGKLGPGQRILDPFCGSGTVLLESYLNGFSAVGTDLNVLAVKIARVKTEILDLDPYLRDRLLAKFHDCLHGMEDAKKWIRIFPESVQEELLSWFPKPVLAKLGWLLHEIEHVQEPRVRELLQVITSSIVRDISQQDPKDLRIRRRRTPLTDAPVYEFFSRRLCDVRVRLQHFSERSKKAPVRYLPAKAVCGDCRLPGTYTENGIGTSSIDAIVTSPPYANALPYIDTDRLSILLLLGLNSRDRAVLEASLIGSREINKKRKTEIDRLIDGGGITDIPSKTARKIISEVRRRNLGSNAGFRKHNTAALLYLYFRDMSVVMRNLDRVLKKDGSAFFVIGDNRTVAGGKEIRISSSCVLQEIGTSVGWDLNDVIPITVTKENRLHAKNCITENEIIWFKKKSR